MPRNDIDDSGMPSFSCDVIPPLGCQSDQVSERSSPIRNTWRNLLFSHEEQNSQPELQIPRLAICSFTTDRPRSA